MLSLRRHGLFILRARLLATLQLESHTGSRPKIRAGVASSRSPLVDPLLTVRKGSVCTSPQEDLFFHSCWLQSRGVFGTKEGVSERPATVSQFVILPSTMTERLPRLNTNIMQSVEMSRQRTCSQESSMQAHFESTTETFFEKRGAIAGISQICDRETLQQSVCSLFLGNLACILNPCFEKLRSDCRAWSN